MKNKTFLKFTYMTIIGVFSFAVIFLYSKTGVNKVNQLKQAVTSLLKAPRSTDILKGTLAGNPKAANDGKKYNMYNAAVMTVEPSTGEIIATVYLPELKTGTLNLFVLCSYRFVPLNRPATSNIYDFHLNFIYKKYLFNL